ncbi:MAG: FtsX-like permease family protein [Lachnospiraceae bacterium]|nr:FtsX-like permease family protein [Lachnospiraceae bacterium]
MRPLSPMYYIRENKFRTAIVIFLLFMTTLLFLAGNYIESMYYYYGKAEEYSDLNCVVYAVSSDKDFKDYSEFREKLLKDEKLTVLDRSPRAYSGVPLICTMGFEIGCSSMVFQNKDDLKTAFDKLGINADLSDVKEKSVCISSAMAKQLGVKKGDEFSSSIYKGIEGKYTVDAIFDDDSFIVFYVKYSEEPLEMNVFAENMKGKELRDYLNDIKGDLNVHVADSISEEVESEFAPFKLVFGVGIVILSVVLSVIVNAVITGQFISRRFEFGVYRAIGFKKKEIYSKCASEIMCMDILAIIIGAILILLFSFIVNELYYIPLGRYLPYFSELGLKAFIVSNILVVVPTIFLKGRGMSRVDVTEF